MALLYKFPNKFPNIWTSCLYKQRERTLLADCVDHDQIALEQYDQGVHCLPVILLNAHNILIQKYMVNEQAFPLKWNLKNTVQLSFGGGKMHAFFNVPG